MEKRNIELELLSSLMILLLCQLVIYMFSKFKNEFKLLALGKQPVLRVNRKFIRLFQSCELPNNRKILLLKNDYHL